VWSWKKGSAGFQPVGAGFQPATWVRESVRALVTNPRAISSRQDADCDGLEARAPLLSDMLRAFEFAVRLHLS
jgi:hypothetical protein